MRQGPLAGTEGILVRKKDKLRVVLSLDLIMRSVAVEIDASDLEWIPQPAEPRLERWQLQASLQG